MASYLLRRSGIACGLVAEFLGWRADTMIQVGIGTAYEEVDVLMSEWPGLRVIGIEPHPGIVRQAMRKGKHELILSMAASDCEGKGTLYVKRHHADGASLLAFPISQHVEEEEVFLTTLDSQFTDYHLLGRILLWLDCEGSELAALRGAEQLIQHVDMVNVELTARPLCQGWCSPKDVHRFLVEHDFIRQHVHTHRLSAGQYDAIYVRNRLFKPEYSCDPF